MDDQRMTIKSSQGILSTTVQCPLDCLVVHRSATVCRVWSNFTAQLLFTTVIRSLWEQAVGRCIRHLARIIIYFETGPQVAQAAELLTWTGQMMECYRHLLYCRGHTKQHIHKGKIMFQSSEVTDFHFVKDIQGVRCTPVLLLTTSTNRCARCIHLK